MVDYNFYFSNGYTYKPKYDGENHEQYAEDILYINRDCKITNYDPATSNGKKKGYITIDFSKAGTSIKEGEGDKLSENKVVANFSDKKYSVLHEIARLDYNGDYDKLTMDDIENIDESCKQAWGLKDLVVNIEKGLATLIWGVGDVLRIDFETDKEKKVETKPTSSNNITNNQARIDSTKHSSSLAKTVEGKRCVKPEHDLNLYKNIPTSFNPYIKNVATTTGYSEDFIKYLISNEGFITTAKDIGDGRITVGFGHTDKANSNTNIAKGQKITVKQAFDFLKQDIIDKENEAKKHFDEFDNLPTSFKEAIIDIAFNRGHKAMSNEAVYRSLRANLKQGENNYPAAAVRTRQEFQTEGRFTAGLRKRNCYRFLLAIRDLSPEMQLAAMRRFENAGQYYTITLKSLEERGRKLDADTLRQDWEKIKKNAESNLAQ